MYGARQDAKIGLIQFCLSAPKTDMESNIQVPPIRWRWLKPGEEGKSEAETRMFPIIYIYNIIVIIITTIIITTTTIIIILIYSLSGKFYQQKK